MADYSPVREDKFCPRVVDGGLAGVDVFGTAVRPPLEPAEAVWKLSDLGAYGVTFHDNDVFPLEQASERDAHLKPFRQALDETGMLVPMVTTNLFSTWCSATAGSPTTTGTCAGSRSARWPTTSTWRWSWGRRRSWLGAAEGAESAGPRTRVGADRYKEAFDVLGQYVLGQGYSIRFALEPKPNEPRGDILLPTVATRWRSSTSWSTRSWSASTRRSATRRWPASTTRTAWLRRSGTASSSTSTSTGSTAPFKHQDLRFGAGNARGAFWTVDVVEHGGYDGLRHFDYKPPRTEDMDGVWASAGVGRNYLILREKSRRSAPTPRFSRPFATRGSTSCTSRPWPPGRTSRRCARAVRPGGGAGAG